MIVVADASPLIFLAKVRKLDLVCGLLGRDIRLPRAVHREVVAPGIDAVERETLESFLAHCRIEAVPRPRRFASCMSAADNAALTLAVRCRAGILLCDERATRIVAEAEGIRPLGTLGVLLRAMREEMLTRSEVRGTVDLLVRTHGFRIGVELYQAILAELDR